MLDLFQGIFKAASNVADSVRDYLDKTGVTDTIKQVICSVAVGSRYVHEFVDHAMSLVGPLAESFELISPVVSMVRKYLNEQTIYDEISHTISISKEKEKYYKKIITNLLFFNDETLRILMSSTSSTPIKELLKGKSIPDDHIDAMSKIIWDHMVKIHNSAPELGLLFSRAMFNKVLDKLETLESLQKVFIDTLREIQEQNSQGVIVGFNSIWTYITDLNQDVQEPASTHPKFFRTPFPNLVDFIEGYIVERTQITHQIIQNIAKNVAQLLLAPSGTGKSTLGFTVGLSLANNQWNVYYANVVSLNETLLGHLKEQLTIIGRSQSARPILFIVDDTHLNIKIAKDLLRTIKDVQLQHSDLRLHVIFLARNSLAAKTGLQSVPIIELTDDDTQDLMSEIITRLTRLKYINDDESTLHKINMLRCDNLWEMFFYIENLRESDTTVNICETLTKYLYHDMIFYDIAEQDPVYRMLQHKDRSKVYNLLKTLAFFSRLEVSVSVDFLESVLTMNDIVTILNAYVTAGDISKVSRNGIDYYRFSHSNIANLMLECVYGGAREYNTEEHVAMFRKFLGLTTTELSDIMKIVTYDPYLASDLKDEILEKLKDSRSAIEFRAEIAELMYRISKDTRFSEILAADTGKHLVVISDVQSDIIGALSWHPYLPIFATGSLDSTVRLYDADTGHQLKLLRGQSGNINAVAWRPDGKRLAAAFDNCTTVIWDASDGSLVQVLRGHERGVMSISWNFSGTYIVSGSADRTAKVWNVRTGLVVSEFSRHDSVITGVSWNHERNVIASVSADGQVYIWEPLSGQKLCELRTPIGVYAPPVWIDAD